MSAELFLAGRRAERAELEDALSSGRPELIAIYGRRRVGKTYLVRAVFAEQLCFELTGMRGVPLNMQLANFSEALGARVAYPLAQPRSWVEAFGMLQRLLTQELAKGGRTVVFFDELPWLASPRSGFVSALDHFWNTYGARQRNLIVVICGSAASWMIVNVLHHKGGLHNRVTRSLSLQPFHLQETEEFLRGRGVAMDRQQILELYMAVGGIPYYLDYVRRGWSAAQNIDAMFFTHNAPLKHEFDRLFASLFDNHERHLKLIHALSGKRSGLSREELTAATKISTGGRLTSILSELEATGFVLRVIPFGRTSRDVLYRLIDAFTLFHLRWVGQERPSQDGGAWWLYKRRTPDAVLWSGYAFENVCWYHVRQIKQALGISGILTEQSAWIYRAASRNARGAQVDLIIDRPDGVINLCEIKYGEKPFAIDKTYADALLKRSEIFRQVTGTRKSPLTTFITVHGIAPGGYASAIVASEVRAEAFFS